MISFAELLRRYQATGTTRTRPSPLRRHIGPHTLRYLFGAVDCRTLWRRALETYRPGSLKRAVAR